MEHRLYLLPNLKEAQLFKLELLREQEEEEEEEASKSKLDCFLSSMSEKRRRQGRLL